MNVTFPEAIKSFFANYANFKGRSTRAEYWWVVLFTLLVSWVLAFFGTFGSILSWIFSVAIIIPMLALTTRRFHDVGLSGWLVVVFFVVGIIAGGWYMNGMWPVYQNILSNGGNVDMAAIAPMGVELGKAIVVPSIICFLLGIAMIVICVLPSGKGNKYGPNPYMA